MEGFWLDHIEQEAYAIKPDVVSGSLILKGLKLKRCLSSNYYSVYFFD